MKILAFGNSGSGKSTYARALTARHGLAHLDLNTIVREPDQVDRAIHTTSLLSEYMPTIFSR